MSMSDEYFISPTGIPSRVRELKADISTAERKLGAMKNDLASIQRSCQHNWTEPRYTPVIREGYQDPGDPVGTMGVDWRGPSWVPRDEKPVWTRECKKCLLAETTTSTDERVVKTPRF
jgi:hypothetical protein